MTSKNNGHSGVELSSEAIRFTGNQTNCSNLGTVRIEVVLKESREEEWVVASDDESIFVRFDFRWPPIAEQVVLERWYLDFFIFPLEVTASRQDCPATPERSLEHWLFGRGFAANVDEFGFPVFLAPRGRESPAHWLKNVLLADGIDPVGGADNASIEARCVAVEYFKGKLALELLGGHVCVVHRAHRT